MFDVNYAKEDVVPNSGLNCTSQGRGIRGVDWDYTESSTGTKGYKILLPEGWTESQWLYSTLNSAWDQVYSAHVLYPLVSAAEGTNAYAREVGMMTNNIPFAVTTFPDTKMKYTAKESSEITQKLTDLDSYVDQMRAKFITGVEPITDASWDAYVNQVKNMGLEDILKIKQAAYDRWNAS